MTTQYKRCAGWTLVELLVVLTVLGVLLAAAVPALSTALESRRISALGHAFFLSLQLGRSEAIKRGGRVVLCKGRDACSRTGGWEQGWIVFHDVNNNAQVDAGEAVLRREPAVAAPLRISGNALVESYISYTPLGHTSTTGGGLQPGTLTVCQPEASAPVALQIVISSSGRARTQRVASHRCA